ncbi:MAG: zf-HC2 domain-containing protein [Acidobacteria bacterium]|nr:zf-HC2 domain-containing protein [Acidobacteriota bacterium]
MEHLTESQLRGYLEHGLDPAEILRVHDHLRICHLCADSLNARRAASLRSEFVPLFAGEPSTATLSHVDEEELVLYVNGGLSDGQRVNVEAHLAECEACRMTVEDLQEFARESAESAKVVALPPRTARPAWRGWAIVAAAAVLVGAFLVSRFAGGPGGGAAPQPVYLASLHDASGLLGITAGGELAGVVLNGEDRAAVRQALQSGVLPAGPGELPMAGAGVLRGGAGEAARFELTYPTHHRVLDDRPEFRWSAMAGATAYEVKVFDEKFDPAADSGRVTGTVWRPARALARGRTYLWQVTAIQGGERVTEPAPPRAEARFLVLEAAAAGRIARARSATPSHLLLAVTYAREGLREETLAELEELDRLNPGSAVVANLRRSAGAKLP